MASLKTAQQAYYERFDNDCAEEADPKHTVEKETLDLWASHGGTVFEPSPSTVKKLPSGYYQGKNLGGGRIGVELMTMLGDDLTVLPDSVCDEVMNGIRTFWKKQRHYHQHGFLWKRGVMLWGPPGGGKTTTVRQVCQHVIALGGIAYYVTSPGLDFQALKIIRQIESERPIVVIFEDIDEIVRYNGEAEILSILDGEIQIENVVYIATTNYVGKLGPRFINRPSRFDELHCVEMPNPTQRTAFIKLKAAEMSTDDVQTWVDLTEGLSIAHIKELLIAVNVLEMPIQKAVLRLHQMNFIEDSDEVKLQKGAVPAVVAMVLRKKFNEKVAVIKKDDDEEASDSDSDQNEVKKPAGARPAGKFRFKKTTSVS